MKNIKEKIDTLMIELGFEKIKVNNVLNYFLKGSYYKVNYSDELKSYIIETASSLTEAENNVYEDSDVYPNSLGEKKILEELRKDLICFSISD
ncbi:hypothetical protein ACFVR2_20475 [Gottfriedia sp. NPDC057991]|uniref:hypothetical protein n=1 Tax=Gottfriedia sp. NPDC057991 TaxID=3346298 RepID=UPI0036DA314E